MEAYDDKLAMIELLSPSSPLLKHLILSRFDQDIRYEFPVELLPVRPLSPLFRSLLASSMRQSLIVSVLIASIPVVDQGQTVLFFPSPVER